MNSAETQSLPVCKGRFDFCWIGDITSPVYCLQGSYTEYYKEKCQNSTITTKLAFSLINTYQLFLSNDDIFEQGMHSNMACKSDIRLSGSSIFWM